MLYTTILVLVLVRRSPVEPERQHATTDDGGTTVGKSRFIIVFCLPKQLILMTEEDPGNIQDI